MTKKKAKDDAKEAIETAGKTETETGALPAGPAISAGAAAGPETDGGAADEKAAGAAVEPGAAGGSAAVAAGSADDGADADNQAAGGADQGDVSDPAPGNAETGAKTADLDRDRSGQAGDLTARIGKYVALLAANYVLIFEGDFDEDDKLDDVDGFSRVLPVTPKEAEILAGFLRQWPESGPDVLEIELRRRAGRPAAEWQEPLTAERRFVLAMFRHFVREAMAFDKANAARQAAEDRAARIAAQPVHPVGGPRDGGLAGPSPFKT